jgi:hypothetical protein
VGGLLQVATITAVVVVVAAVMPTVEVVEIDIPWTVVEIGMVVVVEEEEEIDLTPAKTETVIEVHPITLVAVVVVAAAAAIIAPPPLEIATTMIDLEEGRPTEEDTVEIAMEVQIEVISVDEEVVALTGTTHMRVVGEMLVEVETKVVPEALPNTAVVPVVAVHLGVEITIMTMAEEKAEVEAPIMPIDAMFIERIEDIVAINLAIVIPVGAMCLDNLLLISLLYSFYYSHM